jgi:hypothetical protein
VHEGTGRKRQSNQLQWFSLDWEEMGKDQEEAVHFDYMCGAKAKTS